MYSDNYSYPLRINPRLAELLDEASIMSGWDKATICRKAISRLVIDIKLNSKASTLDQFNQHYREIV